MKRLPAEWEPQHAVLLTWPHKDSDWEYLLPDIEQFYVSLCQKLSHYVSLIIAAPKGKADIIFQAINKPNINVFEVESNDTWTRDHGPITLIENQTPTLLDFRFNGWGNKFDAEKDNRITQHLHDAGAFSSAALTPIDFILEGGGIESDGQGTLLTTEQCLLNPNRNADLSKLSIERTLQETLRVERIHWLKHGYLAGDDTDSHIDTLARLGPNDTLLYVQANHCGDEHYDAITKMEYELAELRTASGKPYRMIPLPMPSPIYDPDDGHRLPATYANFLVTNGAVFVPIYNDKMDERALLQVGKAFPHYDIVAIDCTILIRQHGSLHCITMQLPAGDYAQ